jgi:hypothetical protein
MMDPSMAAFRSAGPVVQSFTESAWKNPMGLPLADVPSHAPVVQAASYSFSSHQDLSHSGSHGGERIPVPWSAVKAEMGGGTLGG